MILLKIQYLVHAFDKVLNLELPEENCFVNFVDIVPHPYS